jgi:16S rRNA (guanine527-N7)-methyltransferase
MERELRDSDWKIFEAAFGTADGARSGLAKYLELLLLENEKINLTSITNWDEAVWKHLYDSLLVLKGGPIGAVLDWGTGGGTPGIPLAIWARASHLPIHRIVLLDSVGKKVRAVESFVNELGISPFVSAVQARGEEFVAKEKVDTVVMRAVAPPERVLPWISKRVSRWIFLVGPQSLAQWDAAEPKIKRKGFVFKALPGEALPNGLGNRHIIVLDRAQ